MLEKKLKLKIRPIMRRDEEAAKQVILSGFLERFGFIDDTLNPDLNAICATYSQEEGSLFLVGILEKEIVATGALVTESEGIARIVRMSVQSEYRRMGFAGQMLASLESHAKNIGVKQLVLETNTEWDSAFTFYKSTGYCLEREGNGFSHFYKKL